MLILNVTAGVPLPAPQNYSSELKLLMASATINQRTCSQHSFYSSITFCDFLVPKKSRQYLPIHDGSTYQQLLDFVLSLPFLRVRASPLVHTFDHMQEIICRLPPSVQRSRTPMTFCLGVSEV